MHPLVHIAFDIGAGSGRAIAGWLDAGRLKTTEVHRFDTDDVFINGRHVRNLYRWYEEVLLAVKKAIAMGLDIHSVGVDSMGEDFVLLDEQGMFMGLPPSYRAGVSDDRVLAREEERFGNERIYGRCGNQSVPNDTLRQLIALEIDQGGQLKRSQGLLFLADSFHYLLCGNRCVEHSLASYGKLFNQQRGTWDDDIFRAFHIPDAIKMPIVRCGDSLGVVHPEILRDIGAERPIQVITPCTHDSACAAFSVPDEGDDWVFISSGSWSIVGMQTEKPSITREGFGLNLSNSSMPAGLNMFKKLVTGMWLMQRCQREWAKYTFAQIVSMAERAPSCNWFIDPDDRRFFNPCSMSRAVSDDIYKRYGKYVEPMDAGAIARICFESMSLKYRYTIEKLRSVSGRAANKIYILGGGSQNELLNQYTANACALPVLTGVTEASAVGNLLSQLYGSGELTSAEEAKRLLIRSYPLTRYEPCDRALWSEKYRLFCQNVVDCCD